MGSQADIVGYREELSRLVRKGSPLIGETFVVTSPGARTTAWAAKVKSLSAYNIYNICAVEISDAGSLPVEIGAQMQAVNLAESFLSEGSLPADTYVLMCRVGEKNVFYAPV